MSRRAFTLIELLVAISIISLLSSIVLASLNSARDKARIAAGKEFSANVFHAEGDQAVAIWDFDEGSGTTVADRSGYGNNLTLTNGPTWSTDTPSGTGYSILFDGVNDWSSTADSNSLDMGTSDLTMAAWVKTSFTGSAQRIVSKRFGAYGSGYSLVLDSSGVPYAEILSSSNYITAQGSQSVSDGKWHFVAGIIARNGAGYVCIDGKCGDKVSFAPMASVDLSNNLSLEVGSVVGGTSVFHGNIDEVRVYAKSLTAGDMRSLYASSLPPKPLARN